MVNTAVGRLLSGIRSLGTAPAIVWRGSTCSYADLYGLVEDWTQELHNRSVGSGTVCAVYGDYSPQTCALLLALINAGAITVPFAPVTWSRASALAALAGVQRGIRIDDKDRWSWDNGLREPPPPLIERLRATGEAGLVVFTSGSSGASKAILHSWERVIRKFDVKRRPYRTLLFLLFDHFGGINTLFSVLAYGGVGILTSSRSPEEVCRLVETSRIELLPVTPSFLRFLLTSDCWRRFDLSSVTLVTYGTEVMPEPVLGRLREVFPEARLQQTYGLSEIGVLRSKSRDGSVWVKLGGPGFETKILHGRLWVRSEFSMLGYLNAPTPIDADGWMDTGDMVEVNGDFLRILGRCADVINVGGQKVHPAEIESVLIQAANVNDATVYSVADPILGQVVGATITLAESEDPQQVKARLRRFCLRSLEPYKVPIRFRVEVGMARVSERGKKLRHDGA